MTVANRAVDGLRETLPAVFLRKKVGELTGGLVNPGTLSNIMSRGEGPKAFYLGKKCALERDTFLEWLAPRLSDSNAEALGLENEG